MQNRAIKHTSKSEKTMARILEAAIDEFSAYGMAGARVDRIAQKSRANKTGIYGYFGNKEKLFNFVLATVLDRLDEGVKFDPEDLSGYALQIFDYLYRHQEIYRIMVWAALENNLSKILLEHLHVGSHLRQIENLQKQGRISSRYRAEDLLAMLYGTASAWLPSNITGVALSACGNADLTAARESLVLMVRHICLTE